MSLMRDLVCYAAAQRARNGLPTRYVDRTKVARIEQHTPTRWAVVWALDANDVLAAAESEGHLHDLTIVARRRQRDALPVELTRQMLLYETA
jgi:hypothetical protein